jgi:uncharacterized membrane protein YoaK (UPF0700 family)
MTQAAVAADVDEALDVDRNLGAQVTFDLVAGFNHATQLADFLVGQVAGLLGRIDVSLFKDGLGADAADAKDLLLTLPLLVTGVLFANDTHHALTTNDFAAFAARLDRCSDFHTL